MSAPLRILGYSHGVDPAACLVVDGEVRAYVEEERIVRIKHAPDLFPIRSIAFCLEHLGLRVDDLNCVAYPWDLPRYSGGGMRRFYDAVNVEFPPDPATVRWQQWSLSHFHQASVEARTKRALTRHLGASRLPPVRSCPHHQAHAAAAFYPSPFGEALVLVLDASGDSHCTTIWTGQGDQIERIHEIEIPHSLGWFYAAVTEFLGFRAYDGEYKVMGLAAYGRADRGVRRRLEQVLSSHQGDVDYRVAPRYIHHGSHSWSDRFTDELAGLLGSEPRRAHEPITPFHEALAFEAQELLERVTLALLARFRDDTGLSQLCIGGGVGLNVKLNGRIRSSGLFSDVYVFPIASDPGTAVGAALSLHRDLQGERPARIDHVYWGPAYSDEEIERELTACRVSYRRSDDIAAETAALLASGCIVGWFQGAMEGGPRALGGRSILADPRDPLTRDRVNHAIKLREPWRPFCPSILAEAGADYAKDGTDAPFMIMAFDATEQARQVCPAVVHVDGTMRIQTVGPNASPRFERLLRAFQELTGVPVLLNTSFNVQGEPIVCSPRDALRTFWSTGLDALAIGRWLVEKEATSQANGARRQAG